MITFYLDKKQYSFPNTWNELTPDQFRTLVAVLMDYAEGKITAQNARVLWFCAIGKINPSIVLNRKSGDMVAENITLAASQFTFFFRIEYEGDIFHLSPEIRKQMRRRPPDELPDTPEIRWARRLNYHYVVDASFASQLQPLLSIKKRVFTGYRLALNSGIISTSLTAQQYIDANTIYNRFIKTKDDTLLNELIAVLYFEAFQPLKMNLHRPPVFYVSENIPVLAKLFEKVDPITKLTVLFNFQAFQSFLATRTHFALLWSRSSPVDAPKISLGMADSLYTLAKGGFGSVEELSRINLISFLELLLKNLTDTVHYLHENKVSIAEISDKTGLSITNIQKMI
jgi:hypothetical protein